MLSGIGPPEELARSRHHRARAACPASAGTCRIGTRLPVVNRMIKPWDMLEGATFTKGDPQYDEWAAAQKGIYTTNGVLLSVVARSRPWQPVPDLFCYARARGLSRLRARTIRNGSARRPTALTWVVLKGHTNNTGGTVTLRSDNPRDTPRDQLSLLSRKARMPAGTI